MLMHIQIFIEHRYNECLFNKLKAVLANSFHEDSVLLLFSVINYLETSINLPVLHFTSTSPYNTPIIFHIHLSANKHMAGNQPHKLGFHSKLQN